MATDHGRVRRALIRIVGDENLDLYLLCTVALVFTVLGATGLTDIKVLFSVLLALLALLAFSQIKSRRQVSKLGAAQTTSGLARFRKTHPDDLIARRLAATDILLVGLSMTRTVQGMRADLSAILAVGGRVRVLVLDPTDELLMAVADRRLAHSLGPGRLKGRVLATLDELTAIRDRTPDGLEVRVSTAIPSAGFNCLDAATSRGYVCVQHYEFNPKTEAAPIFGLEPIDGEWYRYFLAEAERLWDAGTQWPLSAESAAIRARRPTFSLEFGPELTTAVAATSSLFLTGLARNTFVTSNYIRLEAMLSAGKAVRFLLINPESTAVSAAADRYYVERSTRSARERIQHTLRLLGELKRTTGGNLTVRLTDHLLSTGMIATDSCLFMEYYTYQSPGEPKFVLFPGNDGFNIFKGEADALWNNGTEHNL